LADIRPAWQGARRRCHGNGGRGGNKINIHRLDKMAAVVVDGHVWSREQTNATREISQKHDFDKKLYHNA